MTDLTFLYLKGKTTGCHVRASDCVFETKKEKTDDSKAGEKDLRRKMSYLVLAVDEFGTNGVALAVESVDDDADETAQVQDAAQARCVQEKSSVKTRTSHLCESDRTIVINMANGKMWN